MGVKISELTELTEINNDDILVVVDSTNTATKKTTYENLKNKIIDDIEYSTEKWIYVGTWIDGRKLYRKIFTIDLPKCTQGGTYVTKTYIIDDILENDNTIIEWVNLKAINTGTFVLPYYNTSMKGVRCNFTTYNTIEASLSNEYYSNNRIILSILRATNSLE